MKEICLFLLLQVLRVRHGILETCTIVLTYIHTHTPPPCTIQQWSLKRGLLYFPPSPHPSPPLVWNGLNPKASHFENNLTPFVKHKQNLCHKQGLLGQNFVLQCVGFRVWRAPLTLYPYSTLGGMFMSRCTQERERERERDYAYLWCIHT